MDQKAKAGEKPKGLAGNLGGRGKRGDEDEAADHVTSSQVGGYRGIVQRREAPKKKRTLPEALRENLWKPGQSGNPVGGRTKSVSTEIRNFLTRKVPRDRKNKIYLEKLVESMVERAIKKSHVLMKEILDRVEGKVPNDPAEAAQYGVKIIIADIPGPPGELNQFIDVVPPKHLKNYGSYGGDNGNKPEE